jgi:predicted acyl esterase
MSTTCRQQHLLDLLLVFYGRQDQQTSTTIKRRWLSRERWPPAKTRRSSLLLKTSRTKNDRKKKEIQQEKSIDIESMNIKNLRQVCVLCVVKENGDKKINVPMCHTIASPAGQT